MIAHPRLPQIRTCGITAYGSSSNTFASLLSAAVSLTRYQGSVTLSCFSPAVLLLDVSHPSAGSFRASSPTSSVLSTRYDFLPSISPHFVAFAWRYHGFIWLVRYPTGQMQPRRAWSWYPGISGRVSAVETTGSPTFLGNLGCAFALLSDPGRIDMSDHHDTPTRPPLCPQRRLPQMYFRGSITQLQHWLSTLRRPGYPNTTQDSLPVAGQALPGGIGYPQDSNERFQTHIMFAILPSQAFVAQGHSTF